MGPFSPEQVLGLLADGEIPDNLHVYPDPKLGAFPEFSGSMTAASLREAYFHDHRIPPAPDMAGSDSIPDAPEPTPDHLTSGDGGQDLKPPEGFLISFNPQKRNAQRALLRVLSLKRLPRRMEPLRAV